MCVCCEPALFDGVAEGAFAEEGGARGPNAQAGGFVEAPGIASAVGVVALGDGAIDFDGARGDGQIVSCGGDLVGLAIDADGDDGLAYGVADGVGLFFKVGEFDADDLAVGEFDLA